MNDRARRIAAPALAILAAVALLARRWSPATAPARLLNADQFADRAASALDERAGRRGDRQARSPTSWSPPTPT